MAPSAAVCCPATRVFIPPVAENKQHPLSNRLRGNGGDLLLKLLAQRVACRRFA
ncbi:Uncharacterised protein [Klebsiella pneumoniae]|uniref:Uncharacterized protein n=1 Tax=Klebsiella pneumoniae TaxID=573 RepID=A0A2X3F9R1_KLEPN|nr:Uncharacterised protein [Klebsiella pneumoniae]